jgi:hypothetical protein
MRTAAGEMPAAAFFSDLAGDLMDRECVKGFAEKTKGAIKESAGKVSGGKELELVQSRQG